MKVIINTFLFVFCASFVTAQITTTSLGNGTYKFDSSYPQNDLHFYIFGDGHHSFERNPQHQFGNNVNPSEVLFYHTEPYTGDEPIDDIVFSVTDGVPNPSISTSDFDNMVSLKRSWNFVQNQDDYLILMFENSDSPTPISGCIEFHYDNNKTVVDENEVLDDYNNNWVGVRQKLNSEFNLWTDKFVWDFTNLEFNEQRFIYIPTNCLAAPATNLKHMAVMRIDDCDAKIDFNNANNGANPDNDKSPFYVLKSKVVTNPHDPNMILSNFECLEGTEGLITVNYKVYFQNEGETIAENVRLDYEIDVPIVNLELLDSSDNCDLTFSQANTTDPNLSNKFGIFFKDIDLPGLFQENPTPHYDETIGWIEFNVCYNLDLLSTNQHCLNSTVDIYFDFEAPVTAKNEICKINNCTEPIIPENELLFCFEPLELFQSTAVVYGSTVDQLVDFEQSENLTELQLFPNPVNDLLNLNGDIDNLESVIISNTQGQSIIVLNKSDNFRSIDVSQLASGMYYLNTTSKGFNKTYTFVKQ